MVFIECVCVCARVPILLNFEAFLGKFCPLWRLHCAPFLHTHTHTHTFARVIKKEREIY